MVEFEWDDAKAASNLRKHGVSFEEAKAVFDRPLWLYHDDFHSAMEDRYIAMGFSDAGRLLFVSHVYRNGRIRIIMARPATRAEAENYAKKNP
jgi:uncharacterized protein